MSRQHRDCILVYTMAGERLRVLRGLGEKLGGWSRPIHLRCVRQHLYLVSTSSRWIHEIDAEGHTLKGFHIFRTAPAGTMHHVTAICEFNGMLAVGITRQGSPYSPPQPNTTEFVMAVTGLFPTTHHG